MGGPYLGGPPGRPLLENLGPKGTFVDAQGLWRFDYVKISLLNRDPQGIKRLEGGGWGQRRSVQGEGRGSNP